MNIRARVAFWVAGQNVKRARGSNQKKFVLDELSSEHCARTQSISLSVSTFFTFCLCPTSSSYTTNMYSSGPFFPHTIFVFLLYLTHYPQHYIQYGLSLADELFFFLHIIRYNLCERWIGCSGAYNVRFNNAAERVYNPYETTHNRIFYH